MNDSIWAISGICVSPSLTYTPGFVRMLHPTKHCQFKSELAQLAPCYVQAVAEFLNVSHGTNARNGRLKIKNCSNRTRRCVPAPKPDMDRRGVVLLRVDTNFDLCRGISAF